MKNKTFAKFIKKTSTFTWICLVLGIFLLGTTCFNEYDLSRNVQGSNKTFYANNVPLVWFVTYCCFFAFAFIPLYKLKDHRTFISLQGKVGFIFIFIFTAIVLAFSSRQPAQTGANIATVAFGIVSFATASLVWFITSQQNEIKQRKEQTLHVMLNSRLSDTYQDHLKSINKHYAKGKGPTSTEVEDYFTKSFDENNKAHKAIKGIIYIMDFYEFVAAGVREGDLDEPFFYKLGRGYIETIWNQSEELRKNEPIKSQKKAWIELKKLVENWEARFKKENEKIEEIQHGET